MPPCESLVRQTARLLEAFRQRNLPVFHVWTTIGAGGEHRFAHWPKNAPKCIEDTPGHRPPNRLQPAPDERIFHKRGFNPFVGGQLESALAELGQPTVVVAGVHLHACVKTAVVECLERGCSVIVAEDAVGSDDPLHAAATHRWLSRRCARFLSVSDCIRELTGAGAPVYHHCSPCAPAQVCFTVSGAGPETIEAAVSGVRQAGVLWRTRPLSARLEPLANLANLMRASAAMLASRMAFEIGKPISHGLEEIERTAQNIEDVIRRALQAGARVTAAGTVRARPLGVVAIVTPWNNPVAIPLGKLAPALAYGNAAVWKPAPAGIGLAREVASLLDTAGLPRGLVAVLEGDAQAARNLAESEGVDAVSLTGSPAAGFSMQEICARRCLPFQAELGGNNAAIVWEDANREETARQIAWGALAFAGQRCTANRRVIIPEPELAGFLDALTQAARLLVWGDPADPKTDIGPVISIERREELEAFIGEAHAAGQLQALNHPHTQPRLSAGADGDAYARPTLAVCGDPNHALVREEWMAPLLVIQPAEDFDHALELCNGVRHGLAAALFSRSPALKQRFLETAQAGILKLNASTTGVDPSLPFGGWKSSGVGPPEHGEGDALFYQRLQTIYGTSGAGTPDPSADS